MKRLFSSLTAFCAACCRYARKHPASWGAALAAAFPMALVLELGPGTGFYDDWYDNMWFIGYYGEYFRAHFSFPALLNTNQTIGIAIPPFYSYTLYPMLGIFSSLVGADLALRLSLYGLCLASFTTAYTLLKKLELGKAAAFGIACLITWEPYLFTTIYNRGSLPEVYANLFLSIALLLCFHIALATQARQKFETALLLTLCSLMAAGSWPPAAIEGFVLLSATFLALTVFTEIIRREPSARFNLKLTAAAFLLAVLPLLPWVTVTQHFLPSLTRPTGIFELRKYVHIDTPSLLRFCTFPLDYRSIIAGLTPPGRTPYLSAQVNMPLFILLAVSLFVCLTSKKITKTGWTLLLLLLAAGLPAYYCTLSLSRSAVAALPSFLHSVDMHYRYIMFADRAALLGLMLTLTCLFRAGELRHRRFTALLTLFLLGMSAQSVVIKLVQGDAIMGMKASKFNYGNPWEPFGPGRNGKDRLLDFPITATHAFGFMDNKAFPVCPDTVMASTIQNAVIAPLTGNRFGDLGSPATVALPAPAYIKVNMYPFTWNRLFMDGEEIAPERLCMLNPPLLSNYPNGKPFGVTLYAPAGKHTLEIRQTPAKYWLMAHNAALWAIVLFAAGLAAYFSLRLLRAVIKQSAFYNSNKSTEAGIYER